MHEFTWLGWISDHVNHGNTHIVTGSIVALLIMLMAVIYRRSLVSVESEIMPGSQFSLKNLLQVTIEGILSLMEGVIGKDAKSYFPLIGAVFIYIFLNNLVGVIPGILPATENVNTNWAIGVTVFVYYNYVGIKKHGFKNYMKHFLGPVWWLAWLILPIELISHVVRPITLGIRLFGNIFGDHIVVGIFSDLVPLLVPVIFMAFGVFVAFVQAFVFSLLSIVYIGLAVQHEEH